MKKTAIMTAATRTTITTIAVILKTDNFFPPFLHDSRGDPHRLALPAFFSKKNNQIP